MRPALLPIALASLLASAAAAAERVQTTDEANRRNLESAAQAPLRDLNVVRTKVPAVLLQALADPYARPAVTFKAGRKAECAQLSALIKPLNDALGADLDTPSKDEDDLLDKGRETAFGAAASLASDVIPFRGWVRRLTGAERHDRVVQAAITAGAVRRAYLKGLGEARGCEPPATPSHEMTAIAAAAEQQKKEQAARGRFRPRYPTR